MFLTVGDRIMQIINKPKCETENCKNEALGVVLGKWRCGECIRNFDKKLKEAGEKYFITE